MISSHLTRRSSLKLLGSIALGLLAATSTAPANTTQWTDGFESYAAGSFPTSNWTNSGNSTAYVTNTQSSSGSNSLYLYGVVGGDWAAIAYRQFTPSSDYIISFDVRNGTEQLSGLHQGYGSVQLNTGPSWTTDNRGLIEFGEDDEIHADAGGTAELSGTDLQMYTPGTWYDVQIEYKVVNPTTVSLTYTIDGQNDGTYDFASISDESSLGYLGLASQAGSAWFDNVSITNVTAAAAAPLPSAALTAGPLLAAIAFFGAKAGPRDKPVITGDLTDDLTDVKKLSEQLILLRSPLSAYAN